MVGTLARLWLSSSEIQPMQSKVGGLKQFSKVLAQVQKAAGKTNVNMSVRCLFGITQASRARVFFSRGCSALLFAMQHCFDLSLTQFAPRI